ncbi:hypothetical protein [Devosia sp.]|uniref:hypothetical protein n=1 Tax=Devosia sp. TaxID=1871048 RepID=UPI003A924706
MDPIVRALIGAGVGALSAIFANFVVFPYVLRQRNALYGANGQVDPLQKLLKFVYRVQIPIMFIGIFAFAAFKMGETA